MGGEESPTHNNHANGTEMRGNKSQASICMEGGPRLWWDRGVESPLHHHQTTHAAGVPCQLRRTDETRFKSIRLQNTPQKASRSVLTGVLVSQRRAFSDRARDRLLRHHVLPYKYKSAYASMRINHNGNGREPVLQSLSEDTGPAHTHRNTPAFRAARTNSGCTLASSTMLTASTSARARSSPTASPPPEYTSGFKNPAFSKSPASASAGPADLIGFSNLTSVDICREQPKQPHRLYTATT